VVSGDQYFGELHDNLASGRIQAGWNGWVADYPAPSGFIGPQLTCSAPENYARFCDRSLDTAIRRAGALQISDPDRANALWAQVDQRVTDLAPWVPMTNSTLLDFVSRRVGNYQYNPQWRMLFDQAWVR
jgi:peptide/nickel transport system substrate-binding protein